MLVWMLADVAGELNGAPLPGKGEIAEVPESLGVGLIEDGNAEIPKSPSDPKAPAKAKA